MKINYTFFALICMTFSGFAKDTEVEFKEIIGSGIFDVNKTRSFVMDESSLIYLDEAEISLESFEIIGSGFTSTLTLNQDTTSEVISGTINALELTTNIKGPVTSLNPLMILEQPVLQTSDTVRAYSNKLNINQNVAVSGYLSGNNSLKAGRIMNNESDWKIRGYASQVQEDDFKIGNLHINRSKESLIDCESGFNNDTLVEVKMAVDVNYQVGMPVETIQSIRCLIGNRLASEAIVLPSVLQGFISMTQGQGFWLDDIKVNVSNATEFINGEDDFIDEAVNVEVQGSFNSVASELQADAIRFIEQRIELTFPVFPKDIVVGQSVTLLGTTFYLTPQTKDNANIFAADTLKPMQVQIQGYVDSKGKAYITKTIDKGEIDYNAVSLRGSISDLSNPEFTALGIVVDASDSLIINLGTGVIDVESLFSVIDVGSQIDIKNAIYNDSTGYFTNGAISLRKINTIEKTKVIEGLDTNYANKEIIGSGFLGGFVRGTISMTADQLFVSGFE